MSAMSSGKGTAMGYKPRQLTTRVGALTLLVPQVRDGQFSTELFARSQRSGQALVLTLMEMVVDGDAGPAGAGDGALATRWHG